MRRIVLLVVGLWLSQGCAVILAAQGSPSPNLSAVQLGRTRGEVELLLGAPSQVSAGFGTYTTAVYRVTLGDESSPGAAVGHAIADLLTGFAWELVGCPLELMRGTIVTLVIDYDANSRVAAVNSTRY